MAKIRQSGAVSIFAVIFAALLLTILTVGFVKIMMEDQQQATSNDLSQSAYDASLAGVEDAKRVIQSCYQGNISACNALSATSDCQVISRSRGVGAVEETPIRSTTVSGERFDQAYTCVNIDMYTDDYLFALAEGEAEVVPLRARGDFNKIQVDWYIQDDAGAEVMPTAPSAASGLPVKSAWGAATPPLVRAQLIRPGGSIDLATIDSDEASQTAFLRPTTVSNVPGAIDNAVVLTAANRPRPATDETLDNRTDGIICSQTFNNEGYACRTTLEIGTAISEADSANAFLRLNTLYKGGSLRVRLYNDNTLVQFNGVQPAVDSTGRASNLYRRIEARLQIGDDFPYPNYTIDVVNALCKDYSVSVESAFGGSCNP